MTLDFLSSCLQLPSAGCRCAPHLVMGVELKTFCMVPTDPYLQPKKETFYVMVLKAQCSSSVQEYELLQEGLFSASVWEDVEKAFWCSHLSSCLPLRSIFWVEACLPMAFSFKQ